ncbi:MAG TPA: lipid A-modifier LpxR family protein, partial [Puia sp.]|nr:lipid A-modifier LpxR family protein [Puia sp.]
KTFLISLNQYRRERVSTQLSTGIIGPWAGNEDMQKDIHRWIHYIQPLGWHNQVQNDIVLNYQFNNERQLLTAGNCFSLSSYASARIGTLSTRASAGMTAMLGHFDSPFSVEPQARKKKFQFYLYDMPVANAIGYDATLQGGLFNHSSVYTIPANNINRITFVNRWGIVVIFKRLYLEYFQSWNSPEFSTSTDHRSGGLQIGFGF